MTRKRTRIIDATCLVVALSLVLSCAVSFGVVTTTVYADPTLPFTLIAPTNVTMTKTEGDAPTTMGFAYSISNDINEFFVGYAAALEAGTLAQYLQSKGVDADEMWMNIQIDWALDDVDDEVSGWHHNEYWDKEGATGELGTDEDGRYRYSHFGWDVLDLNVDTSKTVTETWLYRGLFEYGWLGDENVVGLKDQLRSSQYTFAQYVADGDVTLSIDWSKHTIYSRARFVVVLRKDETPTRYVFSDWSAVVAYGKDAAKVEPLKEGDVVAPIITGLRLTDKTFNDNPVVAFTLTVPNELAAQKAQIAAQNGTLRVEVEGRIQGTTEWTDLHVAGEITTGELEAALAYLTDPSHPVLENPQVELRARYFIEQNGQEDFYSGYSKIIGFDSDDIVYNNSGTGNASGGGGQTEEGKSEQTKHKCKVCGICPEPFGICLFILLAIIAAVAIAGFVVYKVIQKAREKQKENQNDDE